jgi:hypothetical protein
MRLQCCGSHLQIASTINNRFASDQDAFASVPAMELSATIRDLAGKQLGLAQAL